MNLIIAESQNVEEAVRRLKRSQLHDRTVYDLSHGLMIAQHKPLPRYVPKATEEIVRENIESCFVAR